MTHSFLVRITDSIHDEPVNPTDEEGVGLAARGGFRFLGTFKCEGITREGRTTHCVGASEVTVMIPTLCSAHQP